MVNAWWLAANSVFWLVLLVLVGRVRYRHGIWDGAFNHFLPVVRAEMLRYDAHRAVAIFGADFTEHV